MTAPRRPVMRYHGGKWLLAPWIISHFPRHHVYVEAFAGAASVLMRKPRSPVEIINDLDEDVVNVFRVLRNPESGEELARRIRLTPFSRAEFNSTYGPAGRGAPEVDDPIERARLTLIRQMMGFGTSGLVRNRTGFRATTHRNRNQDYSWDWARYPIHIRAFIERLTGVTVECEPALELIDRHDQPDVLLYVDPPYVHETRGVVRGDGHNGYRHEMTNEDHRALAERLNRCEAMVVLSGYQSDLYEELYEGWATETRNARIQGQGGADQRIEVLWLNAPAVERRRQPTLFEAASDG